MDDIVINDEADRLADYVAARLNDGVDADEMAAALNLFSLNVALFGNGVEVVH